MPSEAQALDRVFHCLSNSTRREVIAQLSTGPASMTELAAPFNMALPSFLQHLQVLENAGLIRSRKTGRVRTFEINPPSILEAETWLDVQRRRWTTRFDQFDELLTRLHEDQNHE
jgi:DNA-binding transcriptional ArsR family regulator